MQLYTIAMCHWSQLPLGYRQTRGRRVTLSVEIPYNRSGALAGHLPKIRAQRRQVIPSKFSSERKRHVSDDLNVACWRIAPPASVGSPH